MTKPESGESGTRFSPEPVFRPAGFRFFLGSFFRKRELAILEPKKFRESGIVEITRLEGVCVLSILRPYKIKT